MISIKIAAACGAFLFATSLSSAGAVAQAATESAVGHTPRLQGLLALSVTPGLGGGTKTVTLTCGPDGGSHPYPRSACDQLRAVGGRLSQLNVDPGPCTREYNPQTVSATGIWEGRLVLFERTYPNPCVLERTTGAVFAF